MVPSSNRSLAERIRLQRRGGMVKPVAAAKSSSRATPAEGAKPDAPSAERLEVERLLALAREHGTLEWAGGKRRIQRVREGMPFEVTSDPATLRDVQTATMHNISEEGVAFWVRRNPECPDAVYFREFSSDGSRPWVRARMTHCTRGLRGLLVGCQFEWPG